VHEEKYDLRRRSERPIEGGLLVSALLSIFVLGIIFVFLLREAIPAFIEIPFFEFLFGREWFPASFRDPRFGALPLMAGSFLVVSMAVLIAVPVGLACAIYIAEVADPRLREVLKPMIEVLAGIPSVVYGFIALVLLSGAIQDAFHTTYRLNALNGALILSLMILPTIISIAEDAIIAVPRDYKEASLALGATRWETIRRVTLPASRSGLTVAVMLGLGRAVGETMAVLMATGNSPVVTLNPLSSVETMTAVIAIEMGEVVYGSLHYHALFALGLLLFIVTFGINLVVDRVIQRSGGARR
jgi:phosphate transport system permease protein